MLGPIALANCWQSVRAIPVCQSNNSTIIRWSATTRHRHIHHNQLTGAEPLSISYQHTELQTDCTMQHTTAKQVMTLTTFLVDIIMNHTLVSVSSHHSDHKYGYLRHHSTSKWWKLQCQSQLRCTYHATRPAMPQHNYLLDCISYNCNWWEYLQQFYLKVDFKNPT